MNRITVLLADDHEAVRKVLQIILNVEEDIKVIGEAADGLQAVHLTRKLNPNVVVMDIGMPLLDGLEATAQIEKLVPATKVLILSAHSDDEYIERGLACGAAGFLIKHSSAEMLSNAIRKVQQGNRVYSSTISKRLHALTSKPFVRP